MGRSANRNESLDPVRWRAPASGIMLRLGIIAALLITAAIVVWNRPTASPCATPMVPAITVSGASTKPVAAGTPATPAEFDIPGLPIASSAPARSRAPAMPVASSVPAATAASGKPSIPDGTVGVPVRLADPTALTLVHPGDRVDLLRLNEAGKTTPVANAALVLDVTGADDPLTGGLLLALAPKEAELAVTSAETGFAILIRPG